MVYTFCFVQVSNERGEDDMEHDGCDYVVVASADREFWLASFPTEEEAIEYTKEVNRLADIWRVMTKG